MANYYVRDSATGGSGSGVAWINAYLTLATAIAGKGVNDVIYVAEDHVEVNDTNVAISFGSQPPLKVICVNHSGSVPPVSADLRTTGRITTTGSANISFDGSFEFHGLIFEVGDASNAANTINLAPSISFVDQRYNNCQFKLKTTNAAARLNLGGDGGTGRSSHLSWDNCAVTFGAAGQTLRTNIHLDWRRTAAPVLGTLPTVLFGEWSTTGRGAFLDVHGVDLSALGAGKTLVSFTTAVATGIAAKFTECKLNASVTKVTSHPTRGTGTVDFLRCGAVGRNWDFHASRRAGYLDATNLVVRPGGSSDGYTTVSWKITQPAAGYVSSWHFPFECPLIAIWNDIVGVTRTATIEGFWSNDNLPKNDEVWLDIGYLSAPNSPQGSTAHNTKANVLSVPTDQPASSAAWTGGLTKPKPFKLAVTFTPRLKGLIYGRVKIAKGNDAVIYIDPEIRLR